MKMYQKILIGIAAGAAVGLFLGPQSLVLNKDTLHVPDPSKLELQVRPAGKAIKLPANVTTDFRIDGEETLGGRQWYHVSWKLHSKHLVGPDAVTHPSGKRLKTGHRFHAYVLKANCPPKSSSLGLKIMAWISPLGEIFLRLILMLVVPLVFTLLVVGVASLGNVESLGKLGLRALGYAVATTSIAILIGLGLALIVGPGRHVKPESATVLAEQFKFLTTDAVALASTAPDIVRFIVQIVPDNPIHSMATNPPNILQIMFFSILFGVALTLIPKKRSEQVVQLLDKASRVLVMLMHVIMAVAPIGVACLIAQTTGTTGLTVIGALGLYMLVVLVGLALHAAGVIGLVVRYLTTVRVRDFWKAIWPAELIAFGTASSAATLPVTMECAEDNLGVSNRIASFAVPLGSSINMDGTALFQAVAVVFIAQVFGVQLTLPALITVFVATLLASIGTAAVPSAGLVTLALICSSIGIPPAGIALVIGVDRLLDMFRSPLNVASDLAGTLFLARLSKEKVHVLKPEDDARTSARGFEKRLEVEQTAYHGEEEEEQKEEQKENNKDAKEEDR